MLNFQDFTRPFGAQTSNQYASAALPAFANVAGSAFNWDAANNQTGAQERIANNRLGADSQANLMAGYGDIGKSLAGLYGGYGTNLTNLLSNQMGAYGQAETARQIGLANSATAAMSGLGQASAGAMGAWGANQAAWAKAMADSQMANQQALAQYGGASQTARAPLLASLANTDLGGYQSGLNYTRDMGKLGLARDLGIGQLGVAQQLGASAGPQSGGARLTAGGAPLGSSYAGGSYDGAGGSGSSGGATLPPYEAWYQSQQSAPAYRSQSRFANRAMNRTDDMVIGGLMDSAGTARRGLQDAYYSSQGMPSQLLGQTVAGFRGMMDSNTGSMNRGMNQFYANMQAPVAIGRNDLAAGVQAGSGLLTGLADRMQSASTAARQAQIASQGRATQSSGGSGVLDRLFPSPVQQEQQRQQVAQMQRAARTSRIASLEAELDDIVNGPQTGRYHPRYSTRAIAIRHELNNLRRQTG